MISVAGLTKRFGAYTAIEDVTFDVAAGEIVGFLGPNGAGKSTTMRILAGVFPPSHGQVQIAGYDVARQPLRARAAVGYFPERAALYTDMTVAHYLTYVGEMKGQRRRAARRDAAAAMDSCSLTPVASRLIGTLSKGFRQRVGIAQALVGTPRVLILDEPTSGLDPEQVADMRALVRDLRQERTVILSTHILSEVEATCDRVIIIQRGRVVALDTPANLNRRVRRAAQILIEVRGPRREVLQALRSEPGVQSVDEMAGGPSAPAPNAHEIVAATVSTAPDRDLREALAGCIARHGWGLRELHPKTLTLEEIFLALTADGGATPASHATSSHLPT